jgi:hypothetical protein
MFLVLDVPLQPDHEKLKGTCVIDAPMRPQPIAAALRVPDAC